MQSFLTPDKLYFKKGCLPVALRELRDELHASRVLIVTDEAMLHTNGLAPVTNALNELGITYGVNAERFDYDAVILCGTPDVWQYIPEGACIVIPTAFASTDVFPWLSADMVILDEDMIGEVQAPEILKAAAQSLHGENASDYTLAWAVQALRLVRNGGSLLHAAALAGLAKAVAEPESASVDLRPDAAEALGLSADELETFLRQK